MNLSDDLSVARARIVKAYDPSLFRDSARQLAELLASNLEMAENSGGTCPSMD